MKATLISKFAMGCSCCVMMMSPTGIFADEPLPAVRAPQAATVSVIRDIALTSGGTFNGQILNAEGLAVAGTEVKLLQGGEEIANSVTDQDGHFKVANLRGGVYQVAAQDTQESVRLWAEDTAPPSAESEVVIVSSPTVVRGQIGGIDAITGIALVAAVTGATFAIINHQDINDLEDKIDLLLASP